MKIFVQSNDTSSRIQIDILNNPPIVRWFNQCMKLQETHPITGHLFFNDSATLVYNPVGDEAELYSELLSTVSKLKILLLEKQITKFALPELPETFNRDQHWCNDVHNLFVAVSVFLENNGIEYWKLSSSWDSRMFEAAKKVNVLIHKLEKWAYPTANSQYIKSYGHRYLQTRFDLSYHGLGLWFELSQEEQEVYHSTLKNNVFYDVVFSNEILGKTYYRSFIDEENADSPAISGIDKTWGNLDIKLDRQREAIFQDSQFQEWTESIQQDINTVPLEFPVGSINPNSDLDYFIKRKTTEVVFYFVD